MRLEDIDKSLLFRSAATLAAVIFILWGCLVTLKPFIPALLLAVILSLATWPAFDWLQRRLNGRIGVASLLMTLFLALCFLLPVLFLGSSLADNFAKLFKLLMDTLQRNNGQVPQWVYDLPYGAEAVEEFWLEHIGTTEQMRRTLSTHAGLVSQWLIGVGTAIGRGILDLSLGVLIAFFLFRHGTQAAKSLQNLLDRFAGPRGQHLLAVSKKTLIGVIYGLLGTAVAQGALAGIGLWIAGVPGAPLLGFLTMILSFIPAGPPLIWVSATIWLFSEGHLGAAIFMGLWGLLIVSGIDNIIRPYFISLGSNLPLLLVLLGVFGGIIAFGFIGLFIGPTLLALAYTLITEWSRAETKGEGETPEQRLLPPVPEA